jgi:hypothetical protein
MENAIDFREQQMHCMRMLPFLTGAAQDCYAALGHQYARLFLAAGGWADVLEIGGQEAVKRLSW